MKTRLKKAAKREKERRRNSFFSLAVALLFAVTLILPGLVGCGGGESEAPAPKKATKGKKSTRKARSKTKLKDQKSPEMVAMNTLGKGQAGSLGEGLDDELYNPLGRRDPFRSFIDRAGFDIEDSGDSDMEVLDITGAVLTKFQIRQLKLVGVLIGILDENIGLVEDPTGKGYMVKVGTRVAKGRITEINLNELVVTEKFKNFLGETKIKESFIRLKKTGEGGE